jgi:membrane protease YdiL (CAAX protease family)
MISYQVFSLAGMWLIDTGIIPISDDIQTVNSLLSGLSGRWDILVIYFLMLFFNIAGEELWWRGYILPRQEMAFGEKTWMLHGVMWTFFHLFKWWDLIGLLPVCLIISYMSQQKQDNWPSFIAHYLFNGLGVVLVIQAVMSNI